MESKKSGNVSRKMDPEKIDFFRSVNVFGNNEYGDTERNKKNLMFDIENYVLGHNFQNEIEEDNNIPKNISLHQSIQEAKSNIKQNVMVFSSEDQEQDLFRQQMLARIKEQQNKKIKPTKLKFKIKDSNKSTIDEFNKFGSISSDTYVPNNLSQSMMMFPNNNKAKKGTDKTKKIDFKKVK